MTLTRKDFGAPHMAVVFQHIKELCCCSLHGRFHQESAEFQLTACSKSCCKLIKACYLQHRRGTTLLCTLQILPVKKLKIFKAFL